MRDGSGDRERLVVAFCFLGLVIAIPFAVNAFALDIVIVGALAVAVLSGSFFRELGDGWNVPGQFSWAKVFFRTFEWFSLAVAGYAILSVIGNNAATSA
jgi:hypothetical protein